MSVTNKALSNKGFSLSYITRKLEVGSSRFRDVLKGAIKSPGFFSLSTLPPQCVGFLSSNLSPYGCEMAVVVAGITSSDAAFEQGADIFSLSLSPPPPPISPQP